jgi:hypothetical protein
MHCCSFVVAAMQSEESGSWGTEFATEEFETPVLQLASFVARSVDNDGRWVLAMKNQHETSCCFPELQCSASSFSAP